MSDYQMPQTEKTLCGCCQSWCGCGDCKNCMPSSADGACKAWCPCCYKFKQCCLLCKVGKILFAILLLLALCKIIFAWGMYGMKGWCMSSQWSCMMGSGSTCMNKDTRKMWWFATKPDKENGQTSVQALSWQTK